MVMTNVPHVGAVGTDTHGVQWTVTEWRLADGSIRIACENPGHGIMHDYAVADDGRWHVFAQPSNTITFPTDDVSRATIDVTESARAMSDSMQRIGVQSGGIVVRRPTPAAAPRVEIDMSALARLIEIAAQTQPNADGRRCEQCTRSREVEYTTAAAAWLCVHCRDELTA